MIPPCEIRNSFLLVQDLTGYFKQIKRNASICVSEGILKFPASETTENAPRS